eukprot:scaffold33304_cov129-Isochrysis_galbana.AAC.2
MTTCAQETRSHEVTFPSACFDTLAAMRSVRQAAAKALANPSGCTGQAFHEQDGALMRLHRPIAWISASHHTKRARLRRTSESPKATAHRPPSPRPTCAHIQR